MNEALKDHVFWVFYYKVQSKICLVVCNVLEQVVQDLLREDSDRKSLNTHIAEVVDKDKSRNSLLRRMLT